MTPKQSPKDLVSVKGHFASTYINPHLAGLFRKGSTDGRVLRDQGE